MNAGLRGMTGSRRRELTTSNMQAMGGGIVIMITMSPFITVVAGTVEGGPERCQRVRHLWMGL